MIENDESLVYYYCKKEDFENIIKSKSLWLTRIIDSNDSEEIKRTLRIIWGKIKGDVIIKRGKFSVDGKSILGIFSIGLTEGVTIEYPEDAYELDEFLQQFES